MGAAVLKLSLVKSVGRSGVPEEGEGRRKIYARVSLGLRLIGVAVLVYLAFAFRDAKGGRIIRLSPFHLRTEWYGILGLIGWAYLVACIAYVLFRENRVALLACVALLIGLYAADKHDAFEHFWLSKYVGIGEALGSHAAITVAGMLLASILITPETSGTWRRARFTLWFIGGFSAAALLTTPLWGISKNDATPAWCLFACAITAALWLVFYLLIDVLAPAWASRPLAYFGQNVLLAYLLSEGLGSWLKVTRLADWYDRLSEPAVRNAVGRSAGVAAVVLVVTAIINRVGVKVKL